MSDVLVYIRAKKTKEAVKQEQKLIEYCKKYNYSIVKTYVDYKTDKESCSKSIREISINKKIERIVILNFSSLGNDSLSVSLELDFLKSKGKDVEIVDTRNSFKIMFNDIIRDINHFIRKIVNSKYKELYSKKYRSKCSIYNKYYHRYERGEK